MAHSPNSGVHMETDLKTVYLNTNEIYPYATNNKLHPDDQIKKIADQIREFGFDQPIVVDENKVVIKGHGRLLAAKELGMKEVPCIVRSDLDENQKRAARIGDNRVAQSDWDIPMLRYELSELDKLDIPLETWTGFDSDELEDWLVPEKHFEEPKKKSSKDSHLEMIQQSFVRMKYYLGNSPLVEHLENVIFKKDGYVDSFSKIIEETS
jgi:hypothetical protein